MSQILSEILNPEVVLGRRGHPDLLETYKDTLGHISFLENAWCMTPHPNLTDRGQRNHFIMAKKFAMEKPKVYRLGKDFGSLLSEVDKDIPMDKLPERFFGYISIPKGVVSDDTGGIAGAYVFIGDGRETCMDPKFYGQKMLWMSIIGESLDEHGAEFQPQYVSMLLKGSFEETFKSLPIVDTEVSEGGRVRNILLDEKAADKRFAAIRCLVNTVLYINSLEPNIDHLRPVSRLTNSERKRIKASGLHLNMCSLPVVAVNWSYMREKTYGIAETWRREHARWQRCGPKFSQVKLITIKGHPVKYGATSPILSNENKSQ